MIVIKKDFVDENTESYCAKGKRLTSGKAYFLKAADGEIYFGGRQCAEIHGTNDLRLVPDFTKSLIAMRGGQSTGGGFNNTSDKSLQDKINAITYLLLRNMRLSP